MKKFAIAAAAGALALGIAAAPASAAGVKVGVLTCHVSSGWGFVFGSSKDLHCNYRPNDRAGEHYIGTVKKFGVDLGYTEGGELIWGVIVPTSSLKPGAPEGRLRRRNSLCCRGRRCRRERACRWFRQVDHAAAAQCRRHEGRERRRGHLCDRSQVHAVILLHKSEKPAGFRRAFCCQK